MKTGIVFIAMALFLMGCGGAAQVAVPPRFLQALSVCIGATPTVPQTLVGWAGNRLECNLKLYYLDAKLAKLMI